jgi:hypothetical protein
MRYRQVEGLLLGPNVPPGQHTDDQEGDQDYQTNEKEGYHLLVSSLVRREAAVG